MDMMPFMVSADAQGNITEDPDLAMCCRRGEQWSLPRRDELIPLPEESRLMLLPGRRALGADPRTGAVAGGEGLAVAAFAAPGYAVSAHPLYEKEDGAPVLPLFAYAAVGYAGGRFWICAKKVDEDRRQEFRNVKSSRIAALAAELLKRHPENRLLSHIINDCAGRYDCPAAKNFILGRYEAPLPTSRACGARCLGCISAKTEDSPLAATPQCRLSFTPDVAEITGVMRIHAQREKKTPILSFGQGCEGEPLANAGLLAQSIEEFRRWQSLNLAHEVTINCNTNASSPEGVAALAKAGLSSIRVSLNSCREALYNAYYRPVNYTFGDVKKSLAAAREHGLFISLNLLHFPGVTDTEEELEALGALVCEYGVDMIQWRNLNIDPDWYNGIMKKFAPATAAGPGLKNFMKRLKKMRPQLRYGYFNPYVGDRPDAPASGGDI